MSQQQEDLALIAILRGVAPSEVLPIGDALYEAGFRCIEVPLNSLNPLQSIALLSAHFHARAIIGAGTVLDPSTVDAVAEAGGQIVISPNFDPGVIRRTKERGMISLPGILSPTEALGALAAGADGVKLFPAEIAGLAGLKAMKAVLPAGAAVYAVGGVDAQNAHLWRAAGAAGLGLGSAIFKPGMAASEVGARAVALVKAWRSAD